MKDWYGLRLVVAPLAREIVIGWLADVEVLGIEEDPDDERRWLAVGVAPWDLARARRELRDRLRAGGLEETAASAVAVERIPGRDWAERWKKTWGPTPVGRTLLVVPTWSRVPDTDRIVLRLDPGMAFGTGTHVTTVLAWELLEDVARERSFRTLLEVGAGSGILSLGLLVGGTVERAVSTEVDPDAVRVLKENADGNRAIPLLAVLTDRVPVAAGAVDLAVANLTAAEHEPVRARLASVLAPEGRLVVSGILVDQEREAREAWEARGMGVLTRREREGWVGLCLERQETT